MNAKHPILNNKATRLFIILGGFFITNALIAEFIGIKIFSLESTFGLDPARIPILGYDLSFSLTAGVLLWPVVFVMTDVINEYFGKKGVRILSYLAVGLISYAYIMVFLAIQLVPADWWPGTYAEQGLSDAQLAFKLIFGQGLNIIIASLIAFLIGQFVDVFAFHRIKLMTGEKMIWLRATGSTLISQFIDSFVVLFVAFYFAPKLGSTGTSPWPVEQVLAVGVVNYIYKFVMAVILTPAIYGAHAVIDRYLGHEEAERLKTLAAGKAGGYQEEVEV